MSPERVLAKLMMTGIIELTAPLRVMEALVSYEHAASIGDVFSVIGEDRAVIASDLTYMEADAISRANPGSFVANDGPGPSPDPALASMTKKDVAARLAHAATMGMAEALRNAFDAFMSMPNGNNDSALRYAARAFQNARRVEQHIATWAD